jgi:hypothetical protein
MYVPMVEPVRLAARNYVNRLANRPKKVIGDPRSPMNASPHASLRILSKDLPRVECSFGPRFVCVEHDDCRRRAGRWRADYTGTAERAGIAVHIAMAIASVDICVAVADDTGDLRPLAQASLCEFEMRVAPIQRRFGGRSHRLRHGLAGKEQPLRLGVYADDVRRQGHFLGRNTASEHRSNQHSTDYICVFHTRPPARLTSPRAAITANRWFRKAPQGVRPPKSKGFQLPF